MSSPLRLACVVAFTSLSAASWVGAIDRFVDPLKGEDGNLGSQQSPFKTVSQAVQNLGPGDRVLLAPGIYRETIQVSGAGSVDQPAVIESADPANPAILSGADAITGWKPVAGSDLAEGKHPHAGELFYVDLDWSPKFLFVGARQQKIAREPDTGWYSATPGDGVTIESEGLSNVTAEDLKGAQMFYFLAKGVVQQLADVKDWGQKGSSVELEKKLFGEREVNFTDGDRFYLQNHSSFLNHPGEWVQQSTDAGTRLIWWPPSKEVVELAEAPRRESVVDLSSASNVILRGLHVRHADAVPTGFGIGSSSRPSSPNSRTGLVIESCSIYQNQRFGISLSGVTGATLRRSLIVDNSYGATASRSRNLTVEENQIAWNLNDGLVIAWDVEDVIVRRNAIHHHSRFAHPDNIQTYRGVKNYLLDSNVLLAGGQNAHTQQTVELTAKNNIIAGASANSFFTSTKLPDSKNTGTEKEGEAYTIEANTFSLSANGAVILAGPGHTMFGNIFDLRGGKYGYGGAVTAAEVSSRDNLFWSSASDAQYGILSGSGRQIFRTLEAFQAAGLEEGSEIADPGFVSVPEFVVTLDGKKIASNTESRLFVLSPSSFAVGDHIEYDFDGVNRVVREADGDSIVVDPPLATAPVTTVVVANWKSKPVGPINLKSKNKRGSNVDFEAFLRADFNGDRKRDVPEWPEGISSPRRAF